MDLSLTKLPWYAQIGVFALLAVGLYGAFYWYYESPMREEMASRQQQLAGLRADITKGIETAKKLPEFQRQVTALEGRLANLRDVLPDEKDAADLLRRMQSIATQSNLTIKSFKPAPVVTKELHAEWPIQLELDGSYHNLALFFDRVGKFTRIVNISGLEVAGKDRPTSSSSITAKCVATTFVLIDAQAPAAAAGAKPDQAPPARPAA
jgi:type IV pilus assembly protein PilO